MSLTIEQVDGIRRAVCQWRRGSGLPGPPPDGQLEQTIEVMLGTSARIGEVLAIRTCDVDVTTSPATVRLCGTIVSPAGSPTHRQSHPMPMKSTRTVSVPSFTAEVLRARPVAIASEAPDQLIFWGADLAAGMLGHTSSKITKEHYIEPDEAVNPMTAEILELLAPRPSEDER